MKFDVFLSHNGKDKPAVEQIARKLKSKGFIVWLDKWNLIPGNPWQEEIEDALDDCKTYAVFVGPSGIGPWENEEMRVAIEERVKDKKRRVIPVLLPGALDNKDLKLPRFLTRLTWVDFRSGLTDKEAFRRLCSGIEGAEPGSSPKTRTKTKPSFSSDALPPVGDLPVGSYLPFPPNPLFEGRVNDLKTLAESLLSNSSAGMIVNQKAITGMGGLGKTQLAVEFAYRYGLYFRGVHWLNLADPTQLDSEIAKSGLQMSLANWPVDQSSQVVLTLNTWKSDGPRLLVLDNFEDVEKINNVLPRLRHSKLRLLITSRRTNWPRTSGLSTLQLELFAPEESLTFFKTSLEKRHDKDEDLATLSERLGHLPLAMELAARYLNGHPRLSVAEYLSQTKEAFEHPSMREWRKDLPAPTQHDLDLQRTFALSWEGVTEEIAQKVFLTAGYLKPNTPISLEIFEKALEISSVACDEALNTLYGLGLLRKRENDQPIIHPLLSEYARGIAKAHPQVLQKYAETVVNESTNSMGEIKYKLGDLNGAQAEFERKLNFFDAIPGGADLFRAVTNLGSLMQQQGDLNGARSMFERALRVAEVEAGPGSRPVVQAISNLGLVMQAQGDLNGARTMFERALEIGERGPAFATIATNLGRLMQQQGDLNGARAMLERALKHHEANSRASLMRAYLMKDKAIPDDLSDEGPGALAIAEVVIYLGLVMQAQGDLNGARRMYERALKIFKKFLSPDHPNINVVQDLLK